MQIDMSALQKVEQQELMLFYHFLLFKSKKTDKKQNKTKHLPKTFYSPIKVDNLQTFNRDEIYSNNKVFIDSNLWIYLSITNKDVDKHKKNYIFLKK